MKQLQRYIKNKLKENTDLIDNQLIDNTLTAEENQTILNGYINPLLSIEEKLPELIQSMPMGQNSLSKRDIWKIIRGCW